MPAHTTSDNPAPQFSPIGVGALSCGDVCSTSDNMKTQAIEKQIAVQSVKAEVIRKPEVIGSLIDFRADGSAAFKKGADVKAPELLGFIETGVSEVGSQSVRLANALRLAHQLPKVKETIGEGDKATVKEIEAFDWITEKLESSHSRFAFQNIKHLVPCLEIRDNTPGLSNVSVFAIKDSLGPLNRLGLISDDARPKLLPNAEANPIVQALKAGKNNKPLREVIAGVKKSRPDIWTPKATTGGASTGTTAAGVQLGQDDTGKVATDLQIILSRVDKLAGAGKLDRKALREALAPLNVLANAPEVKK